MANILAAIGRAAPAINQTMNDILDRPKIEEEWQQRKALTQANLEMMQGRLAEEKKRKEWLNSPNDVTVQSWYGHFGEPFKKNLFEAGRKAKAWDEKGVGTNESVTNFMKTFMTNEELMQPAWEMEIASRREKVEKANNSYLKAFEDKNTPQDKLNKLKQELDDANEEYGKSLKFGKSYDKMVEMKHNLQGASNFIHWLRQSGQWDQLSPQEQKMIMYSAMAGGMRGVQDYWKEREKQLGKTQKMVEKTVDLGDKVEYIYTDGTRETKPKGKLPAQETEGQKETEYDRKYRRGLVS